MVFIVHVAHSLSIIHRKENGAKMDERDKVWRISSKPLHCHAYGNAGQGTIQEAL